jgi:VanZ family protein
MIWIKKPHFASILATLVWVLFIFSFSLQNAVDSSLASSRLASFLLNFTQQFIPNHPFELHDFVVLVRKGAHFINFMILMMCVLSVTFSNIKHPLIISLLFCLLIAIMDESIQLFVAGRSAQLSDIVLDMVGSSFGMFVWLGFKKGRDIIHGS